MNQILSTNNQLNSKKSKESGYANTNTNISNNKNAIIVFSIIALLFGIATTGFGIYKYNSNKDNLKNKEPVVEMKQMENGVSLDVSGELKIQMVKYSWNNEDSIKTNVNNSSLYSTIIKPKAGMNALHVVIVDENGKEYTYMSEFFFEDSKPVIKYDNIVDDENGNKIMKILATDDTAIDYISYKWNDEEKTVVKDEDQQKEFETSIQIKRGENQLTIAAVDIFGNEAIIENLPVIGVKKPEIIVKQTGNVIMMTITHDLGFKKIDFSLNGATYTYDETQPTYDASLSKIEYTYDLQEGENSIIINAYSTENTEFKYTGICHYQQ